MMSDMSCCAPASSGTSLLADDLPAGAPLHHASVPPLWERMPVKRVSGVEFKSADRPG
jgi:hypothetical protein